MSYVKQICDGYNKKSLMGNWYEERIYPDQPFREQQSKQARGKDEGITCIDETGFQRALPRIQRRGKWETTGRIILNDGHAIPSTSMKASFPNQQLQTAAKLTIQPFSKNLSQIFSTELHPNSQLRPNKREHRVLNHSCIDELSKDRQVPVESSHFAPALPHHPSHEKYTNFVSHYKLEYIKPSDKSMQKLTAYSEEPAGKYNQNPEEKIKKSSPLVGQFKKQGDAKEETQVQRSWLPPKDTSVLIAQKNRLKRLQPRNDIQTSLNLNVGIHNIHPKNVADNYFGHHISEITRNAHCSPCDR